MAKWCICNTNQGRKLMVTNSWGDLPILVTKSFNNPDPQPDPPNQNTEPVYPSK